MRTDIHSPSKLVAKDYGFVGILYSKKGNRQGRTRDSYGKLVDLHIARVQEHQERTLGKFVNHKGECTAKKSVDCCHVCGTHIRYKAVFYHARTNEYLVVGFDCASKLLHGNTALFAKIKEQVKKYNTKDKTVETIYECGLGEAYEMANAPVDPDEAPQLRKKKQIIADILGRFVTYGKISDKQIKFVESLLGQVKNWDRYEAAQKAEKEKSADAPEDRVEVQVTVLKVKDTDWGTKVFAKHESGWTCWGTLPREIETAFKGDVIQFTARFKQADNDSKHAFFSRPTKALTLKEAEVTEVN